MPDDKLNWKPLADAPPAQPDNGYRPAEAAQGEPADAEDLVTQLIEARYPQFSQIKPFYKSKTNITGAITVIGMLYVIFEKQLTNYVTPYQLFAACVLLLTLQQMFLRHTLNNVGREVGTQNENSNDKTAQ